MSRFETPQYKIKKATSSEAAFHYLRVPPQYFLPKSLIIKCINHDSFYTFYLNHKGKGHCDLLVVLY